MHYEPGCGHATADTAMCRERTNTTGHWTQTKRARTDQRERGPGR
jgi:hypothetical protein